MPDGQNLNAGQFTTAETTTDLVADSGQAKSFHGNVIFRVGPSSLGGQDNVFSNVVDGIYGLAADGGGNHGALGTGVVGFGSPHGGTGVQGRGGAFKPPGQTDPRGGIGVHGIGGDADDDSSAGYQPSTGVLGVGGNANDFGNFNGLYLSTDQGASWKHVLPFGIGNDDRESLAYDPSSYDTKLGYCTVA